MTREEAVEVYHGLINNKIKEAFEFFAPELIVNKDENVNEDLIGGIMWQRDNLKSEGPHDNNLMLPGFCFTVGEQLAYLEKQKDASKAIEAVERIDKYIDRHVANAHDMNDSNPYKEYYRGWDDALGKMAGILQDVYSNEKQEEQKPKNILTNDDSLQITYLKGQTDVLEDPEAFGLQKKQKPTEWSEDNIKELTEFEAAMLHIGMSFFGGSAGLNPNNTNEVKKQAKLLLELVPKQEWSEEDENVYKSIQTILLAEARFVEERKWFDSIKARIKSACWDEKDEKMVERLITRLNWITYNTRTNDTSPNITFFDEIDWLKSISARKQIKK